MKDWPLYLSIRESGGTGPGFTIPVEGPKKRIDYI